MAQQHSSREDSSYVMSIGNIVGPHLCDIIVPMATSSILEIKFEQVLGRANIHIEKLRFIPDKLIDKK